MRSVGISLRVQSLICLCHVIPMHPHQKYFSSVNEKWRLKDLYCNLVPYCTEHALGTGSISNHLAASQKCPMPDLLHQFNKILRCFVSTLKLQLSSSPLTFQPLTFFSSTGSFLQMTQVRLRQGRGARLVQILRALKLSVSPTPAAGLCYPRAPWHTAQKR